MVGSSSERAFLVLATLYLGGIVAANALAAKLFVVCGVHVTAGALAIPLVYLTTDLCNELYGPARTRALVFMGLGANLVLVVMVFVAGAVPASPLGATQAEFSAMFSVTWRVVAASMVAYLWSSLLDVWVFHRIRRLTGERMFWLRKNASTFISQLADTMTFVIIAFAGVVPTGALLGMGIGQYLVKVSAAPLGTPLTYAVLRFANGNLPRNR